MAPLPFCRKAKRAKKTLICYGDRPCGSAPMPTASAKQCASRDRGTGMIPKNPPLPARGRGGPNHRYLGSNPVAARIKCPNMPDVTLPLPMLPTQRPLPSCCGSDRSCAVPAARGTPALVPQPKTPAAAGYRRPLLLLAAQLPIR
jgi:hypothetical protein